LQSLLDWLITLSPATLYAVLLVTAGIENLVPPFPSDVVVAFGSFVVAQGKQGTMLGVCLSVWVGNVGGAMLVYAMGRRYGAERLERRLAGKKAASREATFRKWFERYGMPAVFVSRFVPGVRAIVPAFAGAARLSVLWVGLMIGTASAIWYGMITVVAFRVGSDWEKLRATVARFSTTAAVIGAVILVVGIAVWLLARRRHKAG
jgi:membrane protein DedA with SNARE-associated domain